MCRTIEVRCPYAVYYALYIGDTEALKGETFLCGSVVLRTTYRKLRYRLQRNTNTWFPPTEVNNEYILLMHFAMYVYTSRVFHLRTLCLHPA